MDWAVILAGGSGTRFWPLSAPTQPKQLLPLAGARSTAEETLDRLAGFVPAERILFVAGRAIAPLLVERLGIDPANVLVEPRAASTGPALVWATWEARRRDPDAAVLSLHADWVIGDPEAFVRAAAAALDAARKHNRLVTVGVVPSRPETGYGYIVPGDALDRGTRAVAQFIEKPDAATALDLMANGALWNTGLFAWTAGRLLDEVRALTPEIARQLPRLEAGDLAGFFEAVTAISIDVGVLERSERVAVVPGHFDWDDVGTWEALARVRPRDRHGNITVGRVVADQAADCIVWSQDTPIVVSGVRDVIVVQANHRILVLGRSSAAEFKRVLETLPPELRELEPPP
jgi:mannose-1-phosphate guanylyltransferase